MLAQLEKPTHDFMALATYLINGREQPPHPDRVAWTLSRNLPTDDPITAALYMAATAERSKRCTNACYHAIIAWAVHERPSPEVMQAIGVKTLALAGLAEHQAIIMGHGDKEHPHLHMMINRVHPDTGRAWSTSHDYRRFDRIMRQLSEEHGFQYVPPHQFQPEMTDELPKGPNSNATYAAKRGANTRRRQWPKAHSRKFGARMSERLDRAASWDDVENAFADEGLELEAKGDGLVAGDAASYTKLSALGLTATAKGLARKFGKGYAPAAKRPPPSATTTRSGTRSPRRSVWTVDAIDVARAIGRKVDVRNAVQDAVRDRKARLARKSLMQQLLAEMVENWKAGTNLAPATTSRLRPRRKPKRRHHASPQR